MAEGSKFSGFIIGGGSGGNIVGNGFYDMGFYRKLDEGSNMSMDSVGSLQTSTCDGSVAMSLENSSVGSNNSRTGILHHNGLRLFPGANFSVGHSVLRPGRVSHAMNEDALAQALMDPRYSTESLENYDEWTIDLRKLNMGVAFAQGAFGKLYRGTYDGEDVAIKLLEKPENDPERPSSKSPSPALPQASLRRLSRRLCRHRSSGRRYTTRQNSRVSSQRFHPLP